MKKISYILTFVIYIQSFGLYAYEGTMNCHKMEQSHSNKELHCKKAVTPHSCKSSQKEKDSDKDCCGEMCKCQHLNHNHILSLLPQTDNYLSLVTPVFLDNIKTNKKNLHGFDPLANILQPPRI